MRRTRVAVAVLAVLVVSAVGLAAWWWSQGDPAESARERVTNPAIVAIGDSYISGEGAGSFEPGTNRVGSNECRRAGTSYPYLIGEALGLEVVSVACSGARVVDILPPADPQPHDGQYPRSPADIAGAEKQLEAVAGYEPDIIVLSIGGNDIGFSEIVRSCILPGSCLGRVPEYYRRIDAVEQGLRDTYAAVARTFPDADLYVVTYPMPLADRVCGAARLGFDEFAFVDEFVGRFGEVISVAGSLAGAHVVDIEDTFEGHAICDPVEPERRAMNSLVVSRPDFAPANPAVWLKRFSSNFHNSYHPTPYGHELIARSVLDQIEKVARSDPGEDPGSTSFPRPPEAPPWVPNEIGPPHGPYPFPPGTKCDGTQLADILNVPPVEADVDVIDLTVPSIPSSVVCHRSYKDRWRSTTADRSGVAAVRIRFGDRHGIPSLHEVVYQVEPGIWVKAAIRRS